MSPHETSARDHLYDLLKQCPVPHEQVISNLGLFLDSKSLSRILGISALYRKIIEVQGVVVEFGTRWGQNLALFSALRGIYEPFNRHRRIVGFDTFEGFPKLHSKDGKSEMMKEGNLALTEGYQQYLEKVLGAHESLNPLSHIRRFDLYVGDATQQIDVFLKEQPHSVIALAYFDFDLYEPTKKCLEAIRPRLTKGSVLGFDEVNDPDSPGETLALMEALGLNNVALRRFPNVSRMSYIVIGE
ncbi:MAG: crotonobetainyl-CoA--carnitine CoA-transferase [Proteobacteria bacterium]|nr:MAG: crotonobetainyl-CoA--carnitine CoA-transferase [Pseudomonadota bacterium]